MGTSGTSLACYGCVEFANNERTLAYHRWACANNLYPAGCVPEILELCACPADSPEEPFTNPIDDEVCWYDPAAPESSEFLGIIILNRPVKNSTFSREVSDGFIQGSILNRPTIKGRSFVFEVLLLATSCEGMDYGKEWLRGLLEDAPCTSQGSQCQSCFGRRMSLRKNCPDGTPTDSGIHEWFSVGLVDGIADSDDSSDSRRCCCAIQPITFTMQSESPFSNSPLPTVICDIDADPDAFSTCYNWTTGCADCDCEENPACDRCKFDQSCTNDAFVIPEPDLPRTEDCGVCTPLSTSVQCCCSSDLPSAYDTTFKIDIYSGFDVTNDAFMENGMRDYTVRVYQNPKGLPCVTNEESYLLWCAQEPCFEISMSYIPYDSTLTIDGRTEKVSLTCNGVCKPYDHAITNSKGSIFPLVSKCVPIMVCSVFSTYNTQYLPATAGVKPAHVTVSSYLRFRQ